MKLGADRKKIAILGVLVAIVAVVLYTDMGSSPEVTVPTAPTAPLAAAVPPATQAASQAQAGLPSTTRRRPATTGSVGEFKPRQGTLRPEDRPDPATVDPTLRLDLLAKVQAVEVTGTSRNIFQFGAAPPPPKPIELPKGVPKIPINGLSATAPPPRPAGPPQPPPPPPITFKYYGYKISRVSGRKEAFLLDGDDIIIAGENDAVKSGRYRVMRIGVNSITIEDTQFKNTQTLAIVPEAAAG